ncbi:histidinol-phosphate transaminase [Desulfopila sp. IMCC35008]|uniref:pyridoxal phosphate-dependent aminotransferase n=1 Tax=Desulfopila sp. IMCC35008 TaxID=2653858 RepID=UPI001F0DF981|nr:histidinol-phosphate transaminase [Desulfopila sp. IMCC35008]
MMPDKTTTAEERYEYISSQHGGYWRDNFIDHNYLYNLYFPPEDFFSHCTENLHQLILNYPVGQSEIAHLAGKLIQQPPEQIVVGNGAAEFIKILAGMNRQMIVPVPSFNEYVNAAPAGKVVEFPLQAPSFQLDVNSFADEAIRTKARIAVVVSPNNPTSLLVPKSELIRLLEILLDHNCILIVDESFIDFAENGESESLEKDIGDFQNLAIIKSMSKAYGICGIRIGYLLTANTDFRAQIQQGLHIWNINGFAEEFLRRAPQYKQQFKTSCEKVQEDRDEFYTLLSLIPGMVVYKPAANYIFCRLPDDGPSAPEVTERLFVEHNIYIKHCQGKTLPESDRYVRIASRTKKENLALTKALRTVLELA